VETINGHAVIADRPHDTRPNVRVILAVRDRDVSVNCEAHIAPDGDGGWIAEDGDQPRVCKDGTTHEPEDQDADGWAVARLVTD
jgi:hypothetical protein